MTLSSIVHIQLFANYNLICQVDNSQRSAVSISRTLNHLFDPFEIQYHKINTI
jgi:hypothetical protein